MTSFAAYRSLGTIDALSTWRDSLLRWMVALTPAFGLLFRYAVPAIAARIDERFGFDLAAYYPLLMSFLPIAVAGMVGTVVGFLLLDQRDDQTLTALLVTPLSLHAYFIYRMAVLMPACAVLSCMTVLIAGLTQTTPLQVAVVCVIAAPLAPIYALFLATVAQNKVQGFALAKILGIVIVPCIAAYFVPGPLQLTFGVIPHYWTLKAYWLFDVGAVRTALAYAVVGVGWQAVLLVILMRRFASVMRG